VTVAVETSRLLGDPDPDIIVYHGSNFFLSRSMSSLDSLTKIDYRKCMTRSIRTIASELDRLSLQC